MSWLPAHLEAWDAFFYAREPATTIALFRILFGLVLLANALLFARHARLWIGEQGFLPKQRFLEAFGHSRFTLFTYLPPSDKWVSVVLGAHLVAAACLTVGLATRSSAAFVFVTLASLQHRNPLVLYGGDHVLRIMSFLLIFSRAGEVWSLDQWLGARAGAVAVEGTAWCTRLMQLQVSIVYFKAALAKLGGETWRHGSAVYYAVESAAFRRTRLPHFARNLFGSRLATWGTLAVEFALGGLVWVPALRYPALLAGVTLHLLMEAFMNLQLFGVTMIVCLTLFIEPQVLEALLGQLR
ncbi:MAG TPA: HTTM domain-containing protein [Vicinamibacteria bacterium]